MHPSLQKAHQLQTLILGELQVTKQSAAGDNILAYHALRAAIIDCPHAKPHIPPFIKNSPTLEECLSTIRQLPTSARRLRDVQNHFRTLLLHLEEIKGTPSHSLITDSISLLNSDYVQSTWQKAAQRVSTDPSAALTEACGLIESTCKHILHDLKFEADYDTLILTKLASECRKRLTIGMTKQMEEIFDDALQASINLVYKVGNARNKFGSAHGRGPDHVSAERIHAALLVTIAGAVATFLVEVHFLSKSGTTNAP